MRRTNYFKGYLPIYSLAFAEKIMKRGFCPKKIVKNQKEKKLFVFLFEKDFELYNLVRELRKNKKAKRIDQIMWRELNEQNKAKTFFYI